MSGQHSGVPAWHTDVTALATAHAAAPRGVWLAGLACPEIHFWPEPQRTRGMPAAAPYLCRCDPGDDWPCRHGRCPCSGRHKAAQPSERPAGYGAEVPPPMAGLTARCCVVRAMLSEA